ncbi:hypothetical protein L596_006511 [Steinernema carpocapsae]|uniref:Uncharacterized protein n=1 Tax=Steinernema carpocapsae TaxID=34508 RepID=A0A4U8VAW7_STECR|nr:hypothetical protein L596_006511 [Steinernema carpocapsae]
MTAESLSNTAKASNSARANPTNFNRKSTICHLRPPQEQNEAKAPICPLNSTCGPEAGVFADKIVASCIHLHNFVMDREREGQDRHEESLTSAPVHPRAATSATSAARAVRQNLVQYFQNEGAVEYQNQNSQYF